MITWVTNEPATSQVDFGTSSTALNQVASDPALVTETRVTLHSPRSTTYYFRLDPLMRQATQQHIPEVHC